MSKHKITIAAMIGCVIILAGVIHFSLQKNSEQSPANNKNTYQSDQVITSILSKEDEYNKKVRADILNGNYTKKDSMGIDNHIPSNYNDSTTLIEFRTFERKLDGTINPFYVWSLYLLSQVPWGEKLSGGSYGLEGYGLRFVLANNLDDSWYLLFDTEYTARGDYPEDPNNLIRGKLNEIIFRTPESLAPGEIFRVDLIIADRIREKQEEEQTIIAQWEQTKIEKEETMTIQFTEYPKFNELGMLNIEYYDGNISRNFERIGDNTFSLRGPNKLGGELLVVYSYMQGGGRICFYIKNVQKRDLQLPEDASIVQSEEELVTANFSLAQVDPNILHEKNMIALYPDSESLIPFFWFAIDRGGFEKLQDNKFQVETKVLPGTYNVRLLEDMDKYLDMGTVEFTKEPDRTYTLTIE